MTLIALPSQFSFFGLKRIVEGWPRNGDVEVDFSGQRWVHPYGTVGLSCLVAFSRQRGQAIRFSGLRECANVTYWERMGFFDNFGVAGVPRAGIDRPARARFSEVRQIDDIDSTDRISHELVETVSPNENAYQIYSHIVSEALNNVCQHSRAAGYCASQFYPSESQRVRFCIADYGIGLAESLRYYGDLDDASAIEKALEVGVTGRPRVAQIAAPANMRNRGVGLSAIEQLVTSNGGELVIWSGSAIYLNQGGKVSLQDAAEWQGTVVAAVMQRDVVNASFREVMQRLERDLRKIEQDRGRVRRRRPY